MLPHDLIADPGFARPGNRAGADFRLRKGSPAIGSGMPLREVTTDITGARRSADAPDRGAYAAQATGAAPGEAPSAGPTEAGSGSDSPQAGAGTGAGEQNASPSDETSPASGNDARAAGDSEPLARTGAGVAVPLGLAAVAPALGGAIILLLRRKRS
ncbi:choice-of-anchor Q domain-containing protein [Streptomyces sp. NPDC052415]|uniref:choice-of-anchor Q domain-containing protein n=1 Tax=Streptomyces sp. NPDC052415 TaxID=3365690 RepID=UPI0037D80344